MQVQNMGCAALALDHLACLFENVQDVPAGDLNHGQST